MSHPILGKRESLLYYLFVWLMIALFQAIVLRFQINLLWSSAIFDALIASGIYAFLALSFWHSCKFISLEQKNLFNVLVNHIGASILASIVWIGFIYLLLVQIIAPGGSNYRSFFESTLSWRFLIGILLYFVMVAFYYLFIYYQNFHEKLIRESELKSLVKEAELKSLKFQINPHFIFNSLNSINSLILSSPANASEMTVKLAEFLRSTLSSNDIPQKTLADELKTARLYLDIEKVRFRDKINYVEALDPHCLDIPVPNMILQPLYENVIKYGVYESLDTVTIRINCQRETNFLLISIENDYDPESVASRGEGIGLKNIENRLKIIYEIEQPLRIEKEAALFRVNIYIPLDAGEEPLKESGI